MEVKRRWGHAVGRPAWLIFVFITTPGKAHLKMAPTAENERGVERHKTDCDEIGHWWDLGEKQPVALLF